MRSTRQKPTGEPRPKRVAVHLTSDEKSTVKQIADAAGVSESAWLYTLVAPFLTPSAPDTPDQDPLPFPEQTE